MINDSFFGGFILLGFTGQPQMEMIISWVVFFFYIIALSGNMAIILLSFPDDHLQTPMYFFLRSLAILDLSYTTNIVPQMLVNIWGKDKRITFGGCAFQLFTDMVLCSVECILLAVMSYDRFSAVCRPLHYMTIMNSQLCQGLVGTAWVFGVINCMILSPYAMSLPRCQNHHLDHFFCEMSAMIKIACVDTMAMEATTFAMCLIIVLAPLLLILVSYGFIAVAVLKIKSATGRQKAFGTCSSHLIVVSIFYGIVIYMYIQPGNSPNQNEGKLLSTCHSIVILSMNPLIYTLRNKEFKGAIKTLIGKRKVLWKQ
ncbi:putative olfactory receptor 2W6 [Ovis canadensis]|uniref:putative olfactory receptor 2W6 n=1 Tax=Ovis canadensis TaxID=37174 RepID=UPI0037516C0D